VLRAVAKRGDVRAEGTITEAQDLRMAWEAIVKPRPRHDVYERPCMLSSNSTQHRPDAFAAPGAGRRPCSCRAQPPGRPAGPEASGPGGGGSGWLARPWSARFQGFGPAWTGSCRG